MYLRDVQDCLLPQTGKNKWDCEKFDLVHQTISLRERVESGDKTNQTPSPHVSWVGPGDEISGWVPLDGLLEHQYDVA